MVEISRIIVDKYSYVGMKLQFHFKDVFIIGSENCYILPLIFSMEYMIQLDTNIPIIICSCQDSFDDLLNSEVLGCNYAASMCGVNLKMNGKEAIICCESFKEETL